MIIKSHVRGGYRQAADYLKEHGKNEQIRLVEISDIEAKNLDEAFRNMWVVASSSKVKKPLHHISINPFKDERLTDSQVQKIVERCEQKYGYKPGDHQRAIVEHILDGRQHFHVIWNRVSLTTNKAVWPGEHWKKSKQVCREIEKELGLKTPTPRRVKRMRSASINQGRASRISGRYDAIKPSSGRLFNNPLLKIGSRIKSTPKIALSPKPEQSSSVPFKPGASTKGWPKAAVIDWETWGHKDPARFFTIWSELRPPGFVP